MVEVSGSSRRKFLATAGAGVAIAGVAGAAPSLASTGKSTNAAAEKLSPLTTEVVVHVVDPAKGVFEVFFGESAVQVTDLAFASKVAEAILTSGKA